MLPIDIMLNLDSEEHFSSAHDYVTTLSETLSTVVAAVKRHQARASDRQKMFYDFRVSFQYYSEGELVWMRNKARKGGCVPNYRGGIKALLG